MPSFISISSFTIDKILFYVDIEYATDLPFPNNGNVFIVLLPNVVQDLLINDLCWHAPNFWG